LKKLNLKRFLFSLKMITTTEGRPSRNSYESPRHESTEGETKKGMALAKYLPFLGWATTISREDICKDLLAGVTVGVLLIPQSMSYAALAHLPPQFGLYTGFIPLIVFAFLTSSYHISIGPVAPVCVLVGDAVISMIGIDHVNHSTDFGDKMFQEASAGLALVAGVILIGMSLLRLGFVVKFLSVPVMTGFVTGAAFIIFGNQIKGIFGLDCEKTSYFYSTFYDAMIAMDTIHWGTTLVSVLSLAFLCGCKYFNAPRWFPAPFILMFVTTLLSFFLDFEDKGIKIVGDLPSGIPAPAFPSIYGGSKVIIQGFIVAVVAYVGSLGLAKSLARDSPFPYEIGANSELVAYGMSSLIGSFFLAFPPAASFSRSALAFEMQARTPLHGIFTASLMLLALYLTIAFKFLPKCVLAVVIVMSVRRLFLNGWNELVYLGKARSRDFFESIMCLLGVCVLGITLGIVIGCLLSFVSYIYGNSFAAVSADIPNKTEPERIRQSSEGKEEKSAGQRLPQNSEGQIRTETGVSTEPGPSSAGVLSSAGVPSSVGAEETPHNTRISAFSITAPPKQQHAVVIQPKAGVFYANVAKVTDTVKEAVKDIDETLVLDLKYSPCLDSTAARGILDCLAEASTKIPNIIITNCGDTTKKDLERYAKGEAHDELLEKTVKLTQNVD